MTLLSKSETLLIPSDVSFFVQKDGFLIEGILGTIFINTFILDPKNLFFFEYAKKDRIENGPSEKSTKEFPLYTNQNLKSVSPIFSEEKIQIKSLTIGYNSVNSSREKNRLKALFQTILSLLQSSIQGVTSGHTVYLKLIGVGYRVEPISDSLFQFKLGQSHTLSFECPKDVRIFCIKGTSLCLFGVSLQKVHEVAASIRSLKPVEIYKGKGIRYKDETILLKEGKKK